MAMMSHITQSYPSINPIPPITVSIGMTGTWDLVLKDVELGGHQSLVFDVTTDHNFGGNHMADVRETRIIEREEKGMPIQHWSGRGLRAHLLKDIFRRGHTASEMRDPLKHSQAK